MARLTKTRRAAPADPAGALVIWVVNHPLNFVNFHAKVANSLAEEGIRIEVASPVYEGFDRLSDLPFRIHRIRLDRRGINFTNDLLALKDLIALYRRRRPDLVHHATLKPIVVGSIAAARTGVPRIVNALMGRGRFFSDSNSNTSLQARFAAWALQFSLRRPNTLSLFQNTDDRHWAIQGRLVPPETARLVPGAGIDVDRFRPMPFPSGDPVVLLPGRMIKSKGVRDFVAAARILARKGARVRFVLAGIIDPENPDGISPETLDRWHSEGAVEWWGLLPDIIEGYRQATIVCLPTTYGEGAPNVLLEAAACGRPRIATNVPGCRDVIRHGIDGLLVQPSDPEALAVAIQTLVADSPRMSAMAVAGRQLIEGKFSVRHVASTIREVYRELGLLCLKGSTQRPAIGLVEGPS